MSFPLDHTMDWDDEFVILDSPATERNNMMRNNIRTMARQIDTLMTEMNGQARKTKTDTDKLHDTVDTLMTAVQATKAENQNLHSTVGNLKAIVYDLTKGAEMSDVKAKQLNKCIENVDGEVEETRQQLRLLGDEVKGDSVQVQACMENVDVDHVQTIQKLDKLGDDNKELHEDYISLRAQMDTMEDELATATSPTRDAEVKQLRTRVEKLEIKNVELVETLRQRAKRHAANYEILDNMTKSDAILEKKVDTMQQQMSRQEQKSDVHEAKFGVFVGKMNGEIQTRIEEDSDIQVKVDLLHEASTMKIVNLVEKVGELENKVQESEDREAVTQQKLDELTEQLKGQDLSIAPLQSTLEGLCCRRDGTIEDHHGKPVGRVFKGDIAGVYRRQYKCDANGRFHRSDGAIVARAQTFTAIQTEILMVIEEQKAGQEHNVEA